ncbi:hypothetical protein ROTO_10320 [Roseovarius tolerans]|uniref:Coenzyme PQQ synthesis protein D (PqqD) n=1 Tax=Roseovarius tolerans TaxID=74031 RepID=A0A0L6CX54_9RHOB|nr:PqqD family protein [Roseovarius tolerans]KNX42334.1 hypothetical protein ROTO_10320 [Roseovarius tolerans]
MHQAAVAALVVAVVAPVEAVAAPVAVARVAAAVVDPVARVEVAGRAVGLGRPAAAVAAGVVAILVVLAVPFAARRAVLVSISEMPRSDTNVADEGARILRAPASGVARLSIPAAQHALELLDCDAIPDALSTVMPDWAFAACPDEKHEETCASVIRMQADGRYSFRSRWGRDALTGLGLAGATCGAVADITQAYLDARPGLLGLHCGAVRIDGQLVIFTGPYRAGKTTLVTRLGMEPGTELFCDDVLPVEPGGETVALGIQPRLRLPLPDGIAVPFRRQATRSITLYDHRYGYVALPGQAPLGTRAPLAAVVVLTRQEGMPARFSRLRAEDGAACLIRQNIADPGDMTAHYDEIAGMVERLPCVALEYSNLEEAVALVRAAFAGGRRPEAWVDRRAECRVAPEAAEAVPAALDHRFKRSSGVIERVIGADMFLWHIDSREFYRLNAVGGAVWTLLENRVTGQEIADLLCEVFPGMGRDLIAADVARLLGPMITRGLVESESA